MRRNRSKGESGPLTLGQAAKVGVRDHGVVRPSRAPLIIIKVQGLGLSLELWREIIDLGSPNGLCVLNAKLSGGGANAAFATMAPPVLSSVNWRR